MKHNNTYLFHYDNMFCSTDHHQAISTKLRTRCNAMQIVFTCHYHKMNKYFCLMETNNYFILFYSCYCSRKQNKNTKSIEMSEILTAVLTRIQTFWIVKQHQSVKGYQSFQATMSLQNVSSYAKSTLHNITDKMNLHELHHYCSTTPNIFQQLLYFSPAKNQIFKLIN